MIYDCVKDEDDGIDNGNRDNDAENNINDGNCDHKDENDDGNDDNHFEQPYSKEFFAAFEWILCAR